MVVEAALSVESGLQDRVGGGGETTGREGSGSFASNPFDFPEPPFPFNQPEFPAVPQNPLNPGPNWDPANPGDTSHGRPEIAPNCFYYFESTC